MLSGAVLTKADGGFMRRWAEALNTAVLLRSGVVGSPYLCQHDDGAQARKAMISLGGPHEFIAYFDGHTFPSTQVLSKRRRG